jgi:hypothetical protein
MSLKYCGLDRTACASSGPDPIVRSRASLRAATRFFALEPAIGCRLCRTPAHTAPPSPCLVRGWHWLLAVRSMTITGCLAIGLFAVPEVRRGTGESPGLLCRRCPSSVSPCPHQPQLIAAILPCFPFLFPPLLAWHSLGLKPCAQRLRPFCFAQLQRALRVSAPPATFPVSRNPGSRKSCRSPRKSTPPGLGAAASRSRGAQAKRAEKE